MMAAGAVRPIDGRVREMLLQLLKLSNKFALDQGKIWVIGMGKDEHVLFSELIHVVHPERLFPAVSMVFWQAVQKRCAGVVVARSGAPGELTATEEDRRFLADMQEAAGRQGCPLLEYYIFGEGGWFSGVEERLIVPGD